MKRIRIITTTLSATMITLLALLAACAGNRPSIEEFESRGAEVRVYEVFGMDCPGCHSGLENLVNSIKGVQASRANWEKQQLTVALLPDTDVSDMEIFDAIKRANFTPGKRVR